jgi:hypothetical protein
VKRDKVLIVRLTYFANALEKIDPFYETFERITITGDDLLLCGQKYHKGKAIEKEKVYSMTVPVSYRKNHLKRLMKAFNAKGAEGIFDIMRTYAIKDPILLKELKRRCYELEPRPTTRP